MLNKYVLNKMNVCVALIWSPLLLSCIPVFLILIFLEEEIGWTHLFILNTSIPLSLYIYNRPSIYICYIELIIPYSIYTYILDIRLD